MTNLIARIEAADGPSRELFEEAFLAALGQQPPSDYQPRNWRKGLPTFSPAWTTYIEARVKFYRLLDAEAWTSAAEMLVPDGWSHSTMKSGHDARCCAAMWEPVTDEDGRKTWNGYASHPSLALLAAALKARGE